MSELEQLKAQIAFQEKLFFSALTIVVALIGWAALNYQKAEAGIMVAAVVAILAAAAFGTRKYLRIKKLIEELRDA